MRRNSGCPDHISVLANLEELMDIPLTDTQSAHASAETFVKVITSYSQLLRCGAPRRQQRRPPSKDLDSRRVLCDLIHSARISRPPLPNYHNGGRRGE
jgi:hypothetical protein